MPLRQPLNRMKGARYTAGLLGACLLAGTLSSCGVGSLEMVFVKPGRFDYLGCADIAKTARDTAKREQKLKELIDRAEQESVGVIVAAFSYRSDYLKARGELKMLAQAAQSKNCENQQ
jgi:hypothetical protein